jgi:hypothetical protein
MWWGWCSQPTDRSEAPGFMCKNTTTPRGAIAPDQRTAAGCSVWYSGSRWSEEEEDMTGGLGKSLQHGLLIYPGVLQAASSPGVTRGPRGLHAACRGLTGPELRYVAPPLLPVCQWVLKPGVECTRRAFLPCAHAQEVSLPASHPWPAPCLQSFLASSRNVFQLPAADCRGRLHQLTTI